MWWMPNAGKTSVSPAQIAFESNKSNSVLCVLLSGNDFQLLNKFESGLCGAKKMEPDDSVSRQYKLWVRLGQTHSL